MNIGRTVADLSRFGDAYEHGLTILSEAERDPAIKSPLGNVETVTLVPMSREGIPQGHLAQDHGVLRRRNPSADPHMPSGGDPQLRRALIRSTQLIATAIRELMVWDWDAPAWHPLSLSHTHCADCGQGHEPMCLLRHHQVLVLCDEEGQVQWRDPDDLTTRVLGAGEVRNGVDCLRGLLRALEGVELDEADEDVIAACLDAARSAIKQLQWVGVWRAPRTDEIRFCKRKGCVNPDTGLPRTMGSRKGGVCGVCQKRDERARNKVAK